ncbi:IclR family transcriptional regulator C-terminal domain-containing protein [Rhodococcus sp. ZPP]|uniref:IclR family transcriptional regulator domain-containing protein n=1 Tax=Rhodococcus sp. ZPP TaxID=2749906 RepID=UPI001FCB46FB
MTTSPAELLAHLDKIRSDGFTVSVSEQLFGIASVSAPVGAADGTRVAVLGVTGPADALNDTQIARLIPEVRRANHSRHTRPVAG